MLGRQQQDIRDTKSTISFLSNRTLAAAKIRGEEAYKQNPAVCPAMDLRTILTLHGRAGKDNCCSQSYQ